MFLLLTDCIRIFFAGPAKRIVRKCSVCRLPPSGSAAFLREYAYHSGVSHRRPARFSVGQLVESRFATGSCNRIVLLSWTRTFY